MDPNLSIKEREALKLFRDEISDVIHCLDDYQSHDMNLLRWIKAREFNVPKAGDMLRKSLKWREAHDVDNVLQLEIPEFIIREMPFQVPGEDKDGAIICVVPLGKWDLKLTMEMGYKEIFLQYVDQILERGFAYMKMNSTHKKISTQFVIIFDFDQFSISQVMSRQAVGVMMEALRRFEANYPESLKIAFAVNCPKIFELLWPLLKPLLTQHTLSKVNIYGHNSDQWRAILREYIEPRHLPSLYGGTNTVQGNYHSGLGMNWRPRAEKFPDSAFEMVVVPAGEKIKKNYRLEAGTRISWNFKVDLHDIGFQFLIDNEPLCPYARADAHICIQDGLIDCTKAATYSLEFDNTYSRFRSKNLYYAVRIESPRIIMEQQ